MKATWWVQIPIIFTYILIKKKQNKTNQSVACLISVLLRNVFNTGYKNQIS